MGCRSTLMILSCLLWLGTAMYVAGGIYGLSTTLTLFEKYGPVNGSGNPALDSPPQLRWDPIQNKYVPVNVNNPGNRVPKAFNICMGILGAWALIIFVSSFVFIVDSARCDTVIKNRAYAGGRTSDSAISCTSFLTGYCMFLLVAWLIQAGFAVLPILEYRITMQRCWDLKNPDFSPSAPRTICVDLVQYGLILFRETADNSFALMCGPGGNYNPPRGNLAGFCEEYGPTFSAFIICFAGAGLSIIVLALFTLHHSTNFVYLKVRKFEGVNATHYVASGYLPARCREEKLVGSPSMSNSSDGYPQVMPASRNNGVNLVNPNYGSSVPEVKRSQRTPIPEVMSFQRYSKEEEGIEIHEFESPEYTQLDTDSESFGDERPSRPPAYSHANSLRPRDGNWDKYRPSRSSRTTHNKHYSRNGYDPRRDKTTEYSWHESRTSDVNRGRNRVGHSDEEELSKRYSSDEDRSKKSRRKRGSDRDESPSSDYYMTQDRRRSSYNRWN